ncbi:serine/threonine protein kinase, CMGC, CDC2/CDK sub [Dispira parvispora]|uniref:Serine/threonine protein kinase, CMGC, CDC2/CDK sub n=1 Tax=Dispira parvispora TaxID=1520584 RepID=A0A9W8E3P3_9FUNG|nr:serine/threonine protein kinase, CMGC, CDC2/CDK sub [Dispira parvispora]
MLKNQADRGGGHHPPTSRYASARPSGGGGGPPSYPTPSPRPAMVPPSPSATSSYSPSPPLAKKPDTKKFMGCSKLEDYEQLTKLGEGTFGEVHKARHRSQGNIVALKRILMHNEKDGVPITAIREIKILKALDHPNIVPLIDMAVERGSSRERRRAGIYMVFPYMDHDLTGLLENPSVRFTTSQIKCYMRQLLDGMHYLHSQKILHRDMKASNLLINNKGQLRIADFGLARSYDPQQNDRLTNCVVTRWYRPPELLLNDAYYKEAVDMWGVGCVFAEMLRGKPILPGTSDIDQLDRIFRLCGSPTEQTMPGWTELPGCNGVRSFKSYPRRVRDEFITYGRQAADLLDKLLVLDPKKRLSASQALAHDYFWTDPLPASPDDLPTYESSHEYDRRKHRRPPQQHQGHKPLAPPPSQGQGHHYPASTGVDSSVSQGRGQPPHHHNDQHHRHQHQHRPTRPGANGAMGVGNNNITGSGGPIRHNRPRRYSGGGNREGGPGYGTGMANTHYQGGPSYPPKPHPYQQGPPPPSTSGKGAAPYYPRNNHHYRGPNHRRN